MNITWTKTNGKRRQEWKYSCIIVRLPTRMLKTHVKMQFASQIIMFQKTLEYQLNVISICYER
jgi:hypothetical protein